MEHSIHIILIGITLLLGIFIWYWDSLKNRAGLSKLKLFIILITTLFITVHSSPLGLHMSMTHQGQDQGMSHPCCMPQVATAVTPMVIPAPISLASDWFELPSLSPLPVATTQINNKSPPFS